MNHKIKNKIKQVVKCQDNLLKLYTELEELADIEGVVDKESNWNLDQYAIGMMFSKPEWEGSIPSAYD